MDWWYSLAANSCRLIIRDVVALSYPPHPPLILVMGLSGCALGAKEDLGAWDGSGSAADAGAQRL